MGPASGISSGAGRQRLRAGRRGLCDNRDLRIWKGRAAHQWLSPSCGASEQEFHNTPARAPTAQGSHSPGQLRAAWERPQPHGNLQESPSPTDTSMASAREQPAWSTAALPMLCAPKSTGPRVSELQGCAAGPCPDGRRCLHGPCSGSLCHYHQPWPTQETLRADWK